MSVCKVKSKSKQNKSKPRGYNRQGEQERQARLVCSPSKAELITGVNKQRA